jgi:hypothetical protein
VGVEKFDAAAMMRAIKTHADTHAALNSAIVHEVKRTGVSVYSAQWLEWTTPEGRRERADALPNGHGFFMMGFYYRCDGKTYEFITEIRRDAPNFDRCVTEARVKDKQELLASLRKLT